MTTPNIRVIHSSPPEAAAPVHTLIGSDRVNISPVAGQRFDELQRKVSRISGTMLGTSATRAAAEQAAAALSEIEQLAKAARVALGVK